MSNEIREVIASELDKFSSCSGLLATIRSYVEEGLGERTGLPFISSEHLVETIGLSSYQQVIANSQLRENSAPGLGAWGDIFETTASAAGKQKRPIVTLDSLVSEKGKNPPSLADWKRYLRFMAPTDCLGFLPDLQMLGNLDSVSLADLGTLMDLNLMAWTIYSNDLDRVDRICEVGGGYGRLAVGFHLAFPSSAVEFVLVDAIPAVLAQAYEVAGRALGSANVYFAGSHEMPGREDYKIMLALDSGNAENTAQKLGPIDVFINIESFQEMDEDYVSYWLGLASALSTKRGVAYVSNSRNYINLTPWQTPEHWHLEIVTETPRSRGVDHPTACYVMSEKPETNRFDIFRAALFKSQWRVLDDIFLRRSSPVVRRVVNVARLLQRIGIDLYQKL